VWGESGWFTGYLAEITCNDWVESQQKQTNMGVNQHVGFVGVLLVY
jgi:hypothetical protein